MTPQELLKEIKDITGSVYMRNPQNKDRKAILMTMLNCEIVVAKLIEENERLNNALNVLNRYERAEKKERQEIETND